jgi:hypothetical protein
MVITQSSCTQCDTVVQGSYSGCPFCALDDEFLRFLEIFVTSRGNIKEMERETGLGYWTIRSRLDELIEALQAHREHRQPNRVSKSARRQVLEAVERGELSIVEAERMLARLASDK